jgi:hypothetical protein
MTFPTPYLQCKDLALVYSYAVAVQWYGIQQQHGDPRHVPSGRQLTDGRWMLNGDLLSEMYPGGIIGWATEYLTPDVMAQIEVISMSDAEALLPVVHPPA